MNNTYYTHGQKEGNWKEEFGAVYKQNNIYICPSFTTQPFSCYHDAVR